MGAGGRGKPFDEAMLSPDNTNITLQGGRLYSLFERGATFLCASAGKGCGAAHQDKTR